jgi:predicted GNAT family acetyltransferase
VPRDWQVDRSRWIDQMICEAPLDPPPVAPLPLGITDVPEMLELTAVTDPGPFSPQTIQMGNYFGIRASDGRLVAMAGERLRSAAFAEISAVCTLPEFRGRGYARDLVTFLAAQILAAGKTPFLHVKSENGAKVVYHKIGFRLRAEIWLTVVSLR